MNLLTHAIAFFLGGAVATFIVCLILLKREERQLRKYSEWSEADWLRRN